MFLQQRLLMAQLRPTNWVNELVKEPPSVKKTVAKKKPVEKKEEKARTSDDYYFFKSTPKEQAAQYIPKPLAQGVQSSAPKPIVKSADPSKQISSAAPSKWNSSGTWEERNFTPFAHRRIKELLSAALDDFKHGDVSLDITGWKVEGDSQLILVRGKQRLGFELSITAEFKGTVDGVEAKGKINVPSVDLNESEEEDFDVLITLSTPALGTSVYSKVLGAPKKEIIKVIIDRMAQFAKDLRAEAANAQ